MTGVKISSRVSRSTKLDHSSRFGRGGMNGRIVLLRRNVFVQIAKRFYVKETPAEFCMHRVRQHDHENYLCTLLLPYEPRSAAFAVRAFNVEVAQVADQAHDERIREMRLKFWTDALNEAYGDNPPRTPVVLELHRILRKHKLSKRHFKRLIDSRLRWVGNSQFLSMAEMERYVEQCFSSVYYLLLEAHGITDINMDHIASHIGKAQGIATLLRSIPHNAKQRKNMLPQDVLLRYGVSTESIFQAKNSTDLQDAIYEVACYSRNHLQTANSLLNNAEKSVKLIFLPKIAVDYYLNLLRTSEYNVFHPRLQRKNHLFALQLLWHRLLLF